MIGFNCVYRIRRIVGCTVLQVLTPCGVWGYVATNAQIDSVRALQARMALWKKDGTLADRVRVKGVQL
jgi:hypothetical protein